MQVELKNEIVEFLKLNEGDTFVINGNEVFMKISPFQMPELDRYDINAIQLNSNGHINYKHMYSQDLVIKKNFKLVEE